MVALVTRVGSVQFDVMGFFPGEDAVKKIISLVVLMFLIPIPPQVRAQDIPGIEICTAEKTMERRTSCLQSNVDFLQKTITKLSADHQQKIDAANRQIDVLKTAVISLQKTVEDLRAAQKKATDDSKKTDAPPAKDATPAKESGKDAK
jgi:prophage DNA circulation protein